MEPKVYRFEKGSPSISDDLLQEMVKGTVLIEIDEGLFYQIKTTFRALVFYDGIDRFGLTLGPDETKVAEVFCDNERYFVRPVGFLEN